MTHDPEVEAGAIALAYIEKPSNIKATPLEWWKAIPEIKRTLFLFRTSVVLKAVDKTIAELKGVA